jgi:hypothetical protein
MRKLGWLLGIAGAWGAAAGCSERELPLGEGPERGGEAGEGGSSPKGGSAQQSGGRAQGGSNTGGNGSGGEASELGGSMASGGSPSEGGRAEAGAGQGGGGDGGRGGGSGGICNDEQGPLITFPQCSTPTFATTGTQVGSSCSLADTVQGMGCGEVASNMDVNCCLRPQCLNNSDCGANEVCISRLVQSPNFGGSQFEECSMQCGECQCSVYADIDGSGYCFPRDNDLARFNCDTRDLSCTALRGWRNQFEDIVPISPDDRTATGVTSRAASIMACEDQLDVTLVERCGAPSKCDCSGDGCTIALRDFHPLSETIGDARTGYGGFREMCPLPEDVPEYGYGHYSECADGTVRYELVVGGENKYQLVFPRGSDKLKYGHADGYVGEICGTPDELMNIDTGPAPAPTTCRTCAFCETDQGAGGAGNEPPTCVFDAAGTISLPPP